MPYCPYLNQDFDETHPFTDEHIVPLSLGGPDALCIRVSEEANSQLGADVDGPLASNWLICDHRVRLNLPGQSRNPPVLQMDGELLDGDRRVQVRHRVTATGQDLWVKPTVTRPAEGETGLTHIEAWSEEDLQNIGRDLNKKRHRNGLPPIDLDALKEGATSRRIEHPQIEASFEFDTTCFDRAYVKMALGMAHWLFGEGYSRSVDADILRDFLWEEDSSRRARIPLHGQVFPELTSSGWAATLSVRDMHVLGILTREAPQFVAILFGEYPGRVLLAPSHRPKLAQSLGSADRFWVVDPMARRLSEMSLGDIFALHLERRVQRGADGDA